MPQLPTNSTEDLGADDEVKEYKEEEDENASNGAHVDLVNDIKTDLIKRDAESSEPPPRCQQSHTKSPDASTAPIAQLISFQHRYNDQMFAPPPHGYGHHHSHMDEPKRMRSRSTSEIFHPGPYPSPGTPPYHHHVYPIKQERGYYETVQWPHHGTPTPVIASVGSGYYSSYPGHGNITPPGISRHPHSSHPPGHQGDLSRQPVAPSMMHLPVTCGMPTSACSTITASRSPPGNCKDGKKHPHVKKPLNAFMLYMREMRQKVISECTLKESAAINQILGRKWHSLDRAEQAKYYELARKERAIHMQMYPGWTARDNYAQGSKKKKRKRDKQGGDSEITNPKKCRARYGLDRQQDWCKPCRRKKKCIRFVSGNPNPQDIGMEDGDAVKEGTPANSTENSIIPASSSSTENVTSSPSSQDNQTSQSCSTSIPHVAQPPSGS